MAYQKKTYKKFVATAATATLVASAIVPVASASFPDVEETHEFAKYINAAVDAGIINGYADGTFGLNDNLKRSQVVLIIGRYLEKLGYTSKATTSPWSDVKDEEVIKYGNIVKDAGVFTGYADGTLKGGGFITRENMAVVLDRLAKTVTGTSLSEVAKDIEDVKIADLATANADYQASIQALRDLGISTAENFNPKGNLKRGQFAKFIVTAVEKVAEMQKPAIKEVKAINKTTVTVVLNTTVDAVKAENFTIDGASVTAANLGEDKKTVTLTVSSLAYGKEYTVTAKDIEVKGEKTDFGTAKFTSLGETQLFDLKVVPTATVLQANGASNTIVTFQLINKVTGQVDKSADNVVLSLKTSHGRLADNRITVQDGVATTTLTSEMSNVDLVAKVTAEVVEASNDWKDAIGKVAGEATVSFTTGITSNINSVIVGAAESNQADRVTLFFDKEVSVKHFVAQDDAGNLLYNIEGEYSDQAKKTLKSFTAKEIDAKLKAGTIKVQQVSQQLVHGAETVVVKQDGQPSRTVVGVRPVAGNAKAIEVILAKGSVLVDNKAVTVEVKTVNANGQQTDSKTSFNLTDARVPEATSVTTDGLNKLKVKFSEAILNASFVIDGNVTEGELNGNATTSQRKFVYSFGEYNPVTYEDQRDVATIQLTEQYNRGVVGAVAGYFKAGTHGLQVSNTQDYAYTTDPANLGSTQTLSFTVAEDKTRPTPKVSVESPEQFRVTFDKVVKRDAAVAASDAAAFKLKVYDTTSASYVELTNSNYTSYGFTSLPTLQVTSVTNKDGVTNEYVLELTKDWTELYNTNSTNKNYYNNKFQVEVVAKAFQNIANGLATNKSELDLNYSGSPLNAPDTTSPVISSIAETGTKGVFEATMSEPVKLLTDNAQTLAQGQQWVQPTAQFIGKDKDGNAVTFSGTVDGYGQDKGADKVIKVQWKSSFKATKLVGSTTTVTYHPTKAEAENAIIGGGTGSSVVEVTPQSIVDAGGNTNWTLVVRSIADDVGNTAASATKDFTLAKSTKQSVFKVVDDVNNDGTKGDYAVKSAIVNGQVQITITYTEGVQTNGSLYDGTKQSQYTINNLTLPNGTVIHAYDRDNQNGNETVVITLPANQKVYNTTSLSNIININAGLISYDGSKLTGKTELPIVSEGTAQELTTAVSKGNVAIIAANTAITAASSATLSNEIEAVKTAIYSLNAVISGTNVNAINNATDTLTKATNLLNALVKLDAAAVAVPAPEAIKTETLKDAKDKVKAANEAITAAKAAGATEAQLKVAQEKVKLAEAKIAELEAGNKPETGGQAVKLADLKSDAYKVEVNALTQTVAVTLTVANLPEELKTAEKLVLTYAGVDYELTKSATGRTFQKTFDTKDFNDKIEDIKANATVRK